MAETTAPKQIEPKRLGDYLEVMSKAVFQSGMSWKVVESKWAGTREAFQGFDAEKVAALRGRALEALAVDKRLIRNRRKIAAVVDNAARMIELEKEHGSFKKYLRSQGGFDATLAAIKKDFKFMGPMGVYYFLYVVREEVPSHKEFEAKYRH